MFEALRAELQEERLPSPAVRRALREESGLSIRDAAAQCQVTPMTYWRWEGGKVRLRREHARRYRAFLDALREAAS